MHEHGPSVCLHVCSGSVERYKAERTPPALIRPTNEMSGHGKWALRARRKKVCLRLFGNILRLHHSNVKWNQTVFFYELLLLDSFLPDVLTDDIYAYAVSKTLTKISSPATVGLYSACQNRLNMILDQIEGPSPLPCDLLTPGWSNFVFATSAINRLEWHDCVFTLALACVSNKVCWACTKTR